MIKPYQLTIILPPHINEKEQGVFQKKLSSFILEKKGEIKKESSFELKEFAYPIRKEEKGIYLTFSFDFPSEEISDLHEFLRLSSLVLRYLLQQKEKKISPPIKKAGETTPPKTIQQKPKVKMKELDKKIDEILDEEII